ncbi:MAG: glycosyltransferase family A protein, partial [Kovacikia sp.]
MFDKQQHNSQDVAAIVTAMTDKEQSFVRDTIESVLSDPGIGQVVLCIEEKNTWLSDVLGYLLMDSRLEVLQIPLAPLGAVRNQALKRVRLPWVAYCDGDDVWCQGKTLTQRSYATVTECDFVGADHYLTNEKGTICAFASARYIPMPSSWMVRTDVMREHPFDESPFSLGREESGEWWSRTSGFVNKARCPQMLLRYRIRVNSLSTKTPSMQRKAKIVALASKPGLRGIILFLTWCIWLPTRQKEYIWCD